MILSTDGTSVSLWWKCLYTPFIYTLFYIIYTFGYFTHTGYTHFLPCVLFIIIILCVSYDSIHVLNVYVLSRVIYIVFYSVISKSIKCWKWAEQLNWRLSLVSAACAQLSSLPYGESKTFLRQQSFRQFRYLRYGCPHPFSFINPCVNGVSLLCCLVLFYLRHCVLCFFSKGYERRFGVLMVATILILSLDEHFP